MLESMTTAIAEAPDDPSASVMSARHLHTMHLIVSVMTIVPSLGKIGWTALSTEGTASVGDHLLVVDTTIRTATGMNTVLAIKMSGVEDGENLEETSIGEMVSLMSITLPTRGEVHTVVKEEAQMFSESSPKPLSTLVQR